jgi:glutamine cyclotransferase
MAAALTGAMRTVSGQGRARGPCLRNLLPQLLIAAAGLLLSACVIEQEPVATFQIVAEYPHDHEAFTQGLVFAGGFLYEGTGGYGSSSLRKVALASGSVLQRQDLPARYFGEGITIFEGQIIQLTWQSQVGFVYDQESFELIDTFSYAFEGWGITHDGSRLIISDGTPVLHFFDPATRKEISQIVVCDREGPVFNLNELEYVQGEIYANVWQTDRIARIDPDTGRVAGWIDLTGLLTVEDHDEQVDVLNGIAYDALDDRLFVTGKLWPRLFEITVMAAPE